MSRRVMRGIIAISLAFWCVVHGLPLLGVGLLHSSARLDKPRESSKYSEAEIAKLRQTIARHFTSGAQFRRFILITSAGLTAMGIGLYFWGLHSLNEAPSASADSSRRKSKDRPSA